MSIRQIDIFLKSDDKIAWSTLSPAPWAVLKRHFLVMKWALEIWNCLWGNAFKMPEEKSMSLRICVPMDQSTTVIFYIDSRVPTCFFSFESLKWRPVAMAIWCFTRNAVTDSPEQEYSRSMSWHGFHLQILLSCVWEDTLVCTPTYMVDQYNRHSFRNPTAHRM